ncbi:MAG: hypothetical protein JXN64_00930 [Spirochaetes bacterium]|nr:hypothetical protein [Spirochaetota bacterium]
MESVYIWYLTDNDTGLEISNRIKNIGLNVKLINTKTLKGVLEKEIIAESCINILIFDFENLDFSEILSIIRNDQRLQNYQKFIILNKTKIKEALNTTVSYMHMEFLSRPLNKREFILLLEKSVIVERYREVMKYISKEAEARIGTYENLMDINRRELFVTDEEKEDFKNILNYEKNLLKKQNDLNSAIKEYTLLRQKEIFHNKNRIKAEELLGELRRQELLDANMVIKAQENVIDFSSNKLIEANQIINAKDTVEEMGRQEAVKLHKEINKLLNQNEKQTAEITDLRKKLAASKADKSN